MQIQDPTLSGTEITFDSDGYSYFLDAVGFFRWMCTAEHFDAGTMVEPDQRLIILKSCEPGSCMGFDFATMFDALGNPERGLFVTEERDEYLALYIEANPAAWTRERIEEPVSDMVAIDDALRYRNSQ